MDQMKIAHTHTLYLRCTSKKPFTDEAWNENKKRWKMETMDDGGYIQYWIKSYCCWLPLLPRLHIFHVCIPAKLINSKLIPTLHVEFLLFFSTLAAAYWVVRLTCIHFSLSSFDIWCDLWLIVANFLLFFCLAIFVCSAIQVPELKLFARPILKSFKTSASAGMYIWFSLWAPKHVRRTIIFQYGTLFSFVDDFTYDLALMCTNTVWAYGLN